MIRHLFRLVWNRKWSNVLLTLEIAVSFLVLFGIVLASIYFADNYRQPLGFDYGDVWYVSVDVKQETDDVWDETMVEKMRHVLLALHDMPEVESVAGALVVPYTFSYSTSDVRRNGKSFEYQQSEVTDELAAVLRLNVTRGRWFDRDTRSREVVINETFAHALFGDEDPIGKSISGEATGDDEPGNPGEDPMIVTGVVSEYRKDGEYSSSTNVLFNRANLDDPKARPPRNFLVRTKPGTGIQFEEKLVQTLQRTERDWSFEARPFGEMRESWLETAVTPLLVIGLIASFLLIMVGLGLMGVLWQNVTRRTSEIGLRRVQGATAADVCLQFLGELMVVATFGLALGVLVVAQAPLLGITGPIGPGVFLASVAISVALIYLLTAVCGFYPSWLATRVAPVEALRYQ